MDFNIYHPKYSVQCIFSSILYLREGVIWTQLPTKSTWVSLDSFSCFHSSCQFSLLHSSEVQSLFFYPALLVWYSFSCLSQAADSTLWFFLFPQVSTTSNFCDWLCPGCFNWTYCLITKTYFLKPIENTVFLLSPCFMKWLQVCLDDCVLPSQGHSKGTVTPAEPQARSSWLLTLVHPTSMLFFYRSPSASMWRSVSQKTESPFNDIQDLPRTAALY